MVNNWCPVHDGLKALFSSDLILLLRRQLRTSDTKKRRGRSPAAVMDRVVRRNQRRSWRTLWFDWLASASAETAIDWRVDSAWLLAASSLESARVRLDDPVCSTLIRFFEKS